MNRILAALLLLALSLPASAEVWQARYGVAETFNFKLYNADGTLDVDEADGGTEVSVSCNEGAETTATNDFVDEGTFYSIALTATEMQCERIAVVVAATTTEVFFIQTSANASAMTPSYEANVGTVTDGAIVAADFSTTAGAYYHFGIIDQGTAQAATGTTLQLRAAAAFADDEIIGATCIITGGSAGVGQARAITDYVSTTDTATVATWTTTPTGTITYACFGTSAGGGSVSIAAGGITTSSFASGAIDAAAIAADAIGASELATDAIGAAEIAADAIGASEIANNAIDAASTAADFSTEAQDADVESINGAAVCGDGTDGTPWADCP
jgi:hypothetical protein